MSDQGSNKTGVARDDQLKREMQGELKANREVRIEEAYQPEPSGEDEPIAELYPVGGPDASVPSGMTAEGVTLRTDLARHLDRAVYPAKRSALLGSLHRHHAPDALVDRVSSLPAEPAYPNVQAVVRALGFGVEDRRD